MSKIIIDTENKVDVPGLHRWINEKCYETLERVDDPNIKKIKSIYKPEFGPAARLAYTRALKTSITLYPTNVITTAFKLSDPDIPGSEIIYGFLYSNTITETINTMSYTGTERLKHQLYCASASLLSRDGEYRQRVNAVFALMKMIDYYKDIWTDLEEYVIAKINKYNWNTFTECFYPQDELKIYSEELESNITARRFDIIFLVICWFVEFINVMYNMKINHINRLFRVIMKFKDKNEVKVDMEFMNSLVTKYGNKVDKLHNNLNCFTTSLSVGSHTLMKVGQKIIPLNLGEIQNPFNIKYKPWREYLISEKIQSLALNGICSGVPFLADYFYIKNTRKTLFDNFVQYMKLEHSEQAIGIARKLIEAQRSTFKTKSINNSGVSEPINGKNEKLISTYRGDDEVQGPDSYQEIEEWLSGKFRLMHDKINDPIEYAREEIIMSEMSLCITSEYVGRTFYDALNISLENEKYRMDIGNLYENYDTWSKYIFELVYTLYCLNSHEGIMHGDLHLNNFTVHPLYFSGFKDPSTIKNPHMVYILDKNHYYAFPSRQYHIVIIDFSRSIVRPSMLERFENFELINAKKLKVELKDKIMLIRPEERAEFFHDQVVRIIKFYEMYFPDFTMSKKSQLSLLFLNNFDLLFPIIGGFDTYISLNNIIMFLDRGGFDKKYPKNYKLIVDIVAMIETELTTNVEVLLSNPKSITTANIQYTNKKVLDMFFKDYAIIDSSKNNIDEFVKNNTVIDVSVFDNKQIYNFTNFDKYPEYTKIVRYYKDDQLYEAAYTDIIKMSRMQYDKEKIKALGYINNVANMYTNRIF